MNTNIINLTPHDITIVDEDGSIRLVIPASGTLARCKATTVSLGTITVGDVVIPVTATEMGEVEGLPQPQEGTIFVVSLAVAKAVPSRWDVVVPSESVRDSAGRIIGCKSLGRV